MLRKVLIGCAAAHAAGDSGPGFFHSLAERAGLTSSAALRGSVTTQAVSRHQTLDISGSVDHAPEQAARSQLSKLESKVSERREAAFTELADKRASYEHVLTLARRENDDLQAQIFAVEDNITKAERRVQTSRQTAIEYMHKNKVLAAAIKDVQSNISLAQEFVDRALDHLNKSKSDQALEILVTLANEDSEADRKKALDDRINLISKMSRAKASLLQRKIEEDDEDEKKEQSFEDIMNDFQTKLHDMDAAKEANLAALESAFNQTLNQTQREHAKMADQLLDLQEKAEKTTIMADKLVAAVKTLEVEHAHLVKQSQALHGFAERLGMTDTTDLRRAMQEPEVLGSLANAVAMRMQLNGV